jgi:hypothetical protein
VNVVFDPEYDMGYVHFTRGLDGDHTEKPFMIDEYGNVVGMDLDNLSKGVDLTHPRIPRQYVPELARRLRRRGYTVLAEQPEPALSR